MAIVGGLNLVVTEGSYVIDGGPYATVDVGHAVIDAVSLIGAALTAGIGAVSDITDPAGTGGWTDFVDLSSGPYSVGVGQVAALKNIQISVDTVEDALDALRFQVIRDGIIIFDPTAIRNAGGDAFAEWSGLGIVANADAAPDNSYTRLYCASSFKIRAARVGTFADASSFLKIGSVVYDKVTQG